MSERKNGNYQDYHMTLQEIANIEGVSKQWIQQIVDRAIKKLRIFLTE